MYKRQAQQYGADYVSIPYTSIANDGHPTVCGHKYIARQILKACLLYTSDLSFIRNYAAGGDAITVGAEQSVNDFLAAEETSVMP